MGALQHQLGLHRLPIVGGGRAVEVFQSGRGLLTRDTLRAEGELRPIVEQFGVHAQVAVPLTIQGARRGVLLACSATPAYFSKDEQRPDRAATRSYTGHGGKHVAQILHRLGFRSRTQIAALFGPPST